MSDLAIHGTNDAQWINMDSDKDIHVHAVNDESVKIGHDQTIEITNDREITVNGKHTETIKGDTTIKITDGNLFQKVVVGQSTQIIQKAIWIQSFDDQINIDAFTKMTHIVGDNNILITKDEGGIISCHALTRVVSAVGPENFINIEKDGTIDITCLTKINLVVGGSSIKIDTSKITLSVGGNSITIDASGITISGTVIKLNA